MLPLPSAAAIVMEVMSKSGESFIVVVVVVEKTFSWIATFYGTKREKRSAIIRKGVTVDDSRFRSMLLLLTRQSHDLAPEGAV